MGFHPRFLNDELNDLDQAPKIMGLVISSVDGPALVEIAPLNIHVNAKYSCEFTIPYMEANVKTPRSNKAIKI
jgi:hypothetical protein